MKKLVCLMVVLALMSIAGSAWAVFPAGIAAPVQVLGSGSGVTITGADGAGGVVMYVVFPPDTPGTPAAAKSTAVAGRITALMGGPNLLRDVSAAGNINYGRDAVTGDYIVYVLGPNPAGGAAWVKNLVVTCTPHLAGFYSTTPKKLAIYLRNRLRGLAGVATGGPGQWGGVPSNWKEAARCNWNSPPAAALKEAP